MKMKRTVFILTLLLTTALALLPVNAQVEDGAALAEQVLEKYRDVLQREDVLAILPDALEVLKHPWTQSLLDPELIPIIVANPNTFPQVAPELDAQFITLLKTDAEIHAMLLDPQVQALLLNPAAIDALVSALRGAGPVVAPAVDNPPFHIPDAELAKGIRVALGLDAGARITEAAMRGLTRLDRSKLGVADLTGLQHATQLKKLFLRDTKVTDISALAGLTNLEWLALNRTAVSDISALANLTKLKHLYLSGTDVSDISVLANLTKLERLFFSRTAVSDISALANLKSLWVLNLGSTDVSDISVLANLTNLKALYLDSTDVSDISVVANLTKLTTLELSRTAVSDISVVANLTKLEKLYLDGTDVSDISALANLTKLEKLSLIGCPLSPASLRHIAAMKGRSLRFQVYVSKGTALLPPTPPPPRPWVLEDSWRGPRGDQLQHVEAIAFAGNNLVFWASGDRLYKWDFEANRAWWKDFDGLRVIDVAISRYSPGYVAYALRGNSGEEDWVSLRSTADLSWVTGTRQEGVMSLSVDEGGNLSDGGNYLAVRGARNYYIYQHGLFSALRVIDWADTSSVTGAIAITNGREFTKKYTWRTFIRTGSKDWSITVRQYEPFEVKSLPNISVAGKAFTNGPLAVQDGIRHEGLIAVASDASIYYFVPKTSTPTEYTVKSVANSDGKGHRAGAPITCLAVMQDVPGSDDYFNTTPTARGRHYATSTAQDDFVCFWHLDTGALAQKLDVGFSSAEIAFSQDNSYMAVANGAVSGGERRIKIYRWPGDDPGSLSAPAKEVEPVQPTALLSNYPNPFNPETWIPYRLSDPAEVTVSIYSVDGRLVRRLELGQMPAGVYSDKERAAYWDGRNAQGEPVASGVYFYTLSAGDFKATRKMVIRK